MANRFQIFLRKIYIFPIRVYQLTLSQLWPNICLYKPSCSHYTADSILKHGIVKGTILGGAHVFRCNSMFFVGGDDPVPESFSFKQIKADYQKFRRK